VHRSKGEFLIMTQATMTPEQLAILSLLEDIAQLRAALLRADRETAALRARVDQLAQMAPKIGIAA
jgi:hypothetical protein